MCGIAGLIAERGRLQEPEGQRCLATMAAIQSHRGPDAAGSWFGATGAADVGFAHRRLAILDLSAAGNQPFVSRCGQYVLVYNGELYNHLELRRELESLGRGFVSDCDTEVVLQAYEQWGTGAFGRFNGMWALAIADRPGRRVVLCRDRFGEKPLYTFTSDGTVYFASEIKAILAGSGARCRVHLPAVGRFVAQSLLDTRDESFFEGISQLPKGHWVEVASRDNRVQVGPARPYWSPGPSGDQPRHAGEAVEHARALLTDSVRLRLRSDVPVGVLLSGGLDSSAIAAVANGLQGADRLILVSAAGDAPETSEAAFADAVALHLGRYVHKLRLRLEAEEAFPLIERAIWHNDEPIGGFSAVAHYMLMRKARELGVTVLLSGQGADESLCGYRKYTPFHLQDLARRRQLGRLLQAGAGLLVPPWSFLSGVQLGEGRHYLPRSLRWNESSSVLGPAFGDHAWEEQIGLGDDGLEARQWRDLTRLSVPSLTHYEDRMSMAWSREIRLPFLDHRVAAFFVGLPAEQKLHGNWTKWILRQAVAPLLPPKVTWRSDKKGFVTPIEHWLRHQWRDAIADLFEGDLVTASLGLVDASSLRRRFRDYVAHRHQLWQIADIFGPLSLEIWARTFKAHLA